MRAFATHVAVNPRKPNPLNEPGNSFAAFVPLRGMEGVPFILHRSRMTGHAVIVAQLPAFEPQHEAEPVPEFRKLVRSEGHER